MSATNKDHDGHNHVGHKQRPWRSQPCRPQTKTMTVTNLFSEDSTTMNSQWIWRFLKSTPLVFHVFIAAAIMVCGRHGVGPYVLTLTITELLSHLSPEHEKSVAVLIVKEFIKRRPLAEELLQTLAVTDGDQMMWIFLQCLHQDSHSFTRKKSRTLQNFHE